MKDCSQCSKDVRKRANTPSSWQRSVVTCYWTGNDVIGCVWRGRGRVIIVLWLLECRQNPNAYRVVPVSLCCTSHWRTLLKMTRALLVQFMTYQCWDIHKHNQAHISTTSAHKLTNGEKMQRLQWIFLMLINSHKTLTNICTAFINSTMANFFSCHWWQETDDIITVPQ